MGDVVIIDYGSGNLRSAAKALERAAAGVGQGQKVRLTDRPDEVLAAERVVLPGVGAFADCRAGLAALAGMEQALAEAVLDRGRPFLGICVGMQLLATRGLEHRTTDGLGWIDGEVVALEPGDAALKVPHMGWNDLQFTPGCHPLLDGVEPGAHVYFVHSYHFAVADPARVLARVDYGQPVAALIGRDNLAGTQFHPEKSQAVGQRILANFLTWKP
ncbi:imidazole glycerol phosphate synthase subunit HisH [Roseospirillum parvum]|uniref:Imidazole glycerol phosphate synthase subunit HisH n=1 Tax=Roseospirillum parvum TaxID=83401 RepID=A0A1G8DQJ4_9PROT|nr:imidazole glycerol phosphate synthase subunit HisH [Roseospirillum parvum]SDH59954.1 glutamine amidotransferase [Roseospirillum parvum]